MPLVDTVPRRYDDSFSMRHQVTRSASLAAIAIPCLRGIILLAASRAHRKEPVLWGHVTDGPSDLISDACVSEAFVWKVGDTPPSP
jgi:hypothetical protein